VHVVEDDDSSRTATLRLLSAAGYVAKGYLSAEAFLAERPKGAGCLVLDLNLPGPSGFDLQEALAQSDNPLPIVFLTGKGDIPKTVRAMKAGAVDFLPKPADAPVLLDAVARALRVDVEARAERDRKRQTRLRYERLTPREREVFAHVISGQLNKQVAYNLGTTEHTVKVHRRRVMEKLEAGSMADLVRAADDLSVAPVGHVSDTKE
jgi:FixJ family two-component response regulator